MLIDWFTVGAQALNFLILVWLLKRFLYRPVLAAIDAREARIARQIADADETQASALREQAEFRRRNAEFDAQRAELLKQATAAADAERQRLAEVARQAADAALARRQDAERRDAARLRRALADRTRDEVFEIARRVLGDLADATLDERVGAVFLRRFGELEPTALAALASGLDAERPRAIVRSAFELDESLHAAFVEAIRQALAAHRAATPTAPIEVVFETAPALLGGIELVVGGRQLAWNVSDYMSALDNMSKDATPHAAAAAAAAAPPDASAAVVEPPAETPA
jgi:F-type H+-transporting ATPase subunit b